MEKKKSSTPPEQVVMSKKKEQSPPPPPQPPSQSMKDNLQLISNHELNEAIRRLRGQADKLSKVLPDKGARLREALRNHEEERYRRSLLPFQEIDIEDKKPILSQTQSQPSSSGSTSASATCIENKLGELINVVSKHVEYDNRLTDEVGEVLDQLKNYALISHQVYFEVLIRMAGSVGLMKMFLRMKSNEDRVSFINTLLNMKA